MPVHGTSMGLCKLCDTMLQCAQRNTPKQSPSCLLMRPTWRTVVRGLVAKPCTGSPGALGPVICDMGTEGEAMMPHQGSLRNAAPEPVCSQPTAPGF